MPDSNSFTRSQPQVNPTSAVFCTIFREIAANLFGLNIGLTDFQIVTKTTAVYIDQY